jgi:hypothetical protein
MSDGAGVVINDGRGVCGPVLNTRGTSYVAHGVREREGG